MPVRERRGSEPGPRVAAQVQAPAPAPAPLQQVLGNQALLRRLSATHTAGHQAVDPVRASAFMTRFHDELMAIGNDQARTARHWPAIQAALRAMRAEARATGDVRCEALPQLMEAALAEHFNRPTAPMERAYDPQTREVLRLFSKHKKHLDRYMTHNAEANRLEREARAAGVAGKLGKHTQRLWARSRADKSINKAREYHRLLLAAGGKDQAQIIDIVQQRAAQAIEDSPRSRRAIALAEHLADTHDASGAYTTIFTMLVREHIGGQLIDFYEATSGLDY